MRIVTLLLTGCMAMLLSAGDPDPAETQINARVPSPDGKLVAVHAEDLSGGPATGASEDVYALEGSGPLRYADRIFSSECIHDLKLEWEGPRRLRITYDILADLHGERGYAGPWWSPDRRPPHGVSIHYVRHEHSGDC
jgi:hypothetical protein